jgi:hypothetical protein
VIFSDNRGKGRSRARRKDMVFAFELTCYRMRFAVRWLKRDFAAVMQ